MPFSCLTDCIVDIKLWLEENFLHLNEDNTDYVLFGESRTSDFGLSFNSTVKKLGIVFDSSFRFDKQV